MLVEFSVTNFRSIAEKQTLSLVAGTSASKDEKYSFASGNSYAPALLRGACLFGSNGSGKSNLIKAMDFFEEFVLSSAKESQAGEKIEVTPHLFDDEWANAPSEFEVTFVYKGALYQYGFAVDKDRVWEEWLFSRPNDSKARMRNLFKREYDAAAEIYRWDINATFVKGEKEVWKKSTRDNALFLSQAVQLNAENDLKNVFEWVRRHFQPIDRSKIMLGRITIDECLKEGKKDKVLALLQSVDIRIKNLDIKERDIDTQDLPDDMPKELKSKVLEKIKKEKIKNYDIKTIHHPSDNKAVALDFSDESDGTHQIFSLAGIWFAALEDGDTLIIDELDNHLHPHALKALVGLFYSPKTNPNNAQLIFTGHTTSIMQADFMHRDNILFFEKTKKESTEFIPLSDYKLRSSDNFQKAYLQGRYGGVPYVKEFINATTE